jgi:hypothetical protein
MERTQIFIVLNKIILAVELVRIKEVEQSPIKQEEWEENVTQI